VVISVMGGANILDQLRLIDAIRTAGTVKAYTHTAILERNERLLFPLERARDT
jgi:hypothetical protein